MWATQERAKVKWSHSGLKQASNQCKHGATLTVMVSPTSTAVSCVLLKIVRCNYRKANKMCN